MDRKLLRRLPGFRYLNIFRRCGIALGYYSPGLRRIPGWLLHSSEDTNFTYDLSDRSLEYLAHTITAVTGVAYAQARSYFEEVENDLALRNHVLTLTRSNPRSSSSDRNARFGRRLGWYVFARIIKPRLLVETGVDKGLGSVLLCSALLRNSQEGYPGEYVGTDINPEAGWLLQPPYSTVGRVVYGDSIASLRELRGPVDLFINDSDHSQDYEYREYQTIAGKLSPEAVILGDNSHASDRLSRFSAETGRRFIFFREEPRDHWYPGAGIGISYTPAAGARRPV